MVSICIQIGLIYMRIQLQMFLFLKYELNAISIYIDQCDVSLSYSIKLERKEYQIFKETKSTNLQGLECNCPQQYYASPL